MLMGDIVHSGVTIGGRTVEQTRECLHPDLV